VGSEWCIRARRDGVDAGSSHELSPEETARQRTAQFASMLSEFGAEPTDPGWGPTTAAHLNDKLTELGKKNGTRLSDVACHSTICVAKLEWTSYAEATATYAEFIHDTFDLSCAQRILLEPPEASSVGKPYQADLIFDCDAR
jgi:hypothetical protein